MGFKENLKSELQYSGLLVKELSAKTSIPKDTIGQYLSVKRKMPSLDKGVKIAQTLGVSTEYLVTEKDNHKNAIQKLSKTTRLIIQQAEKLDEKNKVFVLDFIKWLSMRKDRR